MNRRQFLSFTALTALPMLGLRHPALARENDMSPYSTVPAIRKNDMPAWEQSPFVLNGELHRAGFRRLSGATSGHSIVIEKYHPSIDAWQRLAEIPFDRYLGCAFVDDDHLYVFAVTDIATSPNKIVRREIDTTSWQFIGPEIDIRQSSGGYKFFNTSVCKGPDKYIMAYETNEAVAFSIRFLQSTDLVNWSPIGDLCRPNTYAACPTVRYGADGNYMVTYLFNAGWPPTAQGPYVTAIARTSTFTEPGLIGFAGNAKYTTYQQLMAPDANMDGINASDVDFIEWNGKVYFTYLTGDQSTWYVNNDAWYDGTMEEFYREFWP